VPPGGSTLVLMDPRDCIETKPKITSKQKPSCLSMLGDAQWNEWMGKLQHYVNQYFHELLPFVFLPIAFLAIGGTLAAHAAGVDIMHYGAGVFLLAFFGILVGRLIISSKNQGLDEEIHQLCGELTLMTSGTVTVEYRTAWTSCCKPKYARTARIIAFVPSGGVQIPSQTIMVQVPPGAVAGQTLQVQTPQGIQMATIPSGVSAGQTFTFTAGAPQVVQAQVVQVEANVVA